MTDRVIDIASLQNLKAVVGDDPDLLAEFVEVFASSVPSQLTEMREALADQDLQRLRIAAHSCKSNARDMGALALSDLCLALEAQCREGALEAPQSQIEAIEAQANRAVSVLTTLDFQDV